MAQYKRISNFGIGVQNTSENPLNYCLIGGLNSSFNNGSTANTIGNPNGANCQSFMSDYCSSEWNDLCEFASTGSITTIPNSLQHNGHDYGNLQPSVKLTTGEILIVNTASKKYLSEMKGCNVKHESFDPTVAGSPTISFWSGNYNNSCTPIYEVNPKTIDNDPVMDKILEKPIIALSILVNIYNTANRKNTFENLKGTKIYNFFQSKTFQEYIKIYNKIS